MKKWLLLGSLASVVLILDQVTKVLVEARIPFHVRHSVIPRVFDLVHVRNRGGAFGMLAGLDADVRGPIFVVLSAAAILLVLGMVRNTPTGRPGLTTALALVLGGALGNLVDRIRLGEVIDFLDFYWGRYHWPAFNVADVAIVLGVGLLLVDIFRHPHDEAAEAADPDPGRAATAHERSEVGTGSGPLAS